MDRIKRYIYSDVSEESNGSNASSSEYYDSDEQKYDSDTSSDSLNESDEESEDEISNHIFNNNWSIWYHHQKNNWKLDSYKNIYVIKNIKDFWNFNNNFPLFYS